MCYKIGIITIQKGIETPVLDDRYAQLMEDLSEKHYVIVGSMARRAMLSEQACPSYRADGSTRDIDFIDPVGTLSTSRIPGDIFENPSNIPLDAGNDEAFSAA